MAIPHTERSIPRDGRGLLRRLRRALQGFGTAAFACLLLACASQAPLPQADTRAQPQPASQDAGAGGEPHTIALLGATGMVGDHLLREALSRGYSVRALARSPAKLARYGSRITVIAGDARDPSAIARLLEGSDVVVSALGPARADGVAARTVNTDATRNVVQAMQQRGIARYIVVSGAGIELPGDARDLLGWWIQAAARITLPDAVKDKQAEFEVLAQSSAAWTLVRCPLIDDTPFRQPVIASLQTPPALRVRAGDLARFVIDEIDARQFVREGPFVGSRQAMAPPVAY